MRTAKQFRLKEKVKFGGVVHIVVDNIHGWLTIVPNEHRNSLTGSIEHSRKVRAKDVLVSAVCTACDWPCDCDEYAINT